ncbi:MAG TPA: M12 family metallo-peptidase [Steroidobacteraceae bacterium]|nr:M12 family metallo-peptidase [Steroidobacteraceae bacterium]
MGTGSKFVAALLALALSAAVQASERPHIQYAEKVTVTTGTAQTQFDAYGRRFVLELQTNERALGHLKLTQPAAIAGYRLWRGVLAGFSGSWVRLTEHAGASEGVIWDGHDLYAVTRYEKIAAYLGTPMAAEPGDTVIFRLSDAINLLPSGYCATGPSIDGLAPDNSLVQYRNMIAELQTQVSAGATKQIEISMIADSAMLARVTDPTGEMLASYNIVDGIFAEQVGLLIVPADMRSLPAAGDPFTATDPSALLAQIVTYRQNTPVVAALGIAHLFTGHELDGDPIGIARLSGACSTDDAVSLTEAWHGTVSNALIMAHEIGHNLGAVHDGDGTCAATPKTFIMAPNLNGSQQFSQCSLTAMSTFIASASCITSAAYAHVELPQARLMVNGELDEPLVVPFDLHSIGTRTANNVKLVLFPIHESLVLTGTTPGVVCTPVTLGLSCEVGSIAAGVTKRVELTFLPGLAAGFTTDATISASNNQNTRNSKQGVVLNVLPNVDVSVSATTSTPTAAFGDNVDVTLTVKSLKTHTARNVRVGTYGGGVRGISANVPAGASCQFDAVNAGQTFCILGDVPGGATRTIVVHSTASQVGQLLQGVVYMSADNDSDNSNNNAYFTMSVVAAHDVGLEDLTTSAPVQFGMPYEYKANLHSYGLQSVSGVHVDVDLTMQDSAALNSVTSVTVGGNTCTKLAVYHYDCIVGTMAASEVLLVSIKGIATGLGETRFLLNSYATINDNTSNDQVYRGWTVRYGLDAAVTGGGQPILVEGREDSGSFAAWSYGTQAANNAVLNVALPPQVRFTRFFARETTTTSCAMIDPQHLRCTYNIPPGSSYQDVSYYLIGDVPGVYQATATITLAGDENPANNTTQWPITVNAALDVGVRSSLAIPQYLIAGHALTVPITVFTGSHPVSGVTANVFAQSDSELTSISTGVGSCTRVDTHLFTCALGNLAGGSSVDLTAVINATSTSGSGSFGVNVAAPGDNVPNNNQIGASFVVAPVGDARVAVAATTSTAIAGTVFSLPSITIWRQGPIVGGKLRITLPAGVSISSMSGSVFVCSGTTTLECDLPSSWPESQGIQVDLSLLSPAASNFVVTARVTAINDFANANDEGTIAVTVNAAQPAPSNPPSNPPSSPPKSGGGGGRLDWPVALLLGLLLVRRQRRIRM